MNLSQSIKDFSQSTDASDRIFFLRCLKTLYETGLILLDMKDLEHKELETNLNLIKSRIKNFKIYIK